MRTSNTAQRLRQLMTERNLRQVDILELCKPYCAEFNVKLGKSHLSQFLSGKSEPGQRKLTVLSKALDVSEAWLMGYDAPRTNPIDYFVGSGGLVFRDDLVSPDNIIPLPKMNRVPLLGTIACGDPILAQENIDENIDLPEHIHADFALRCKGDSMINARIFDGDIVYIRHQPTVLDGQIAAVLIDGEATLKRVRLFDDHIVLEPENPQYRPLSFWGPDMNTPQILGLAVAFTSTVK